MTVVHKVVYFLCALPCYALGFAVYAMRDGFLGGRHDARLMGRGLGGEK